MPAVEVSLFDLCSTQTPKRRRRIPFYLQPDFENPFLFWKLGEALSKLSETLR